MADVLIKNMVLPTEAEQVNITILSDGSVIEHFRNESGRWSSYRRGGAKAIPIPIRKELCEAFEEKCNDYADDAFDKESAIEAFRDTLIEVGVWTY